jgi:hypothetical protein
MDVEDAKVGQSTESSAIAAITCSQQQGVSTGSEHVVVDDTAIVEALDEYSDGSVLPKIQNSVFKRPHNEDGPEHNKTADDSCGMSSLILADNHISKLPPLPSPQFAARRQETRVGVTVVLGISLACIGVTHGIALEAIGGIEKHSPAWWTFLIMVYSEAGIALLCLLGLMWADPGVVKRSPENSFPIPIQCEAWIQAHIMIDGKPEAAEPPPEHYIGSSDPSTPGDSYCVRCLVWRRFKHSTKYFHCSVCQRCVAEFDHHCNVFGRCIAGTPCTGNYKFFTLIIIMGVVGNFTAMASVVWSLAQRFS